MDIQSYRRAETLACQSGLSWRKRAAHTPNAFLAAGFPVRVESIADLVQMVDTMQEDRFDGYMAELGGLNDADLALLIPALADFARFFALTFDSYRAPLPLDTMLGMYVAYRKLDRFMPGAKSVLEIGPGCGYMAFFIKQRAELERYVQIECCESLYMLQYLVNRHAFGITAYDQAAFSPNVDLTGVVARNTNIACTHMPWWMLQYVHTFRFDAVFMNAMLTELTPAALTDYVDLLKATLKPGGIVIVQCQGGGVLPIAHIVATLQRSGFPLTYIGHSTHDTPPGEFCVPTAVFTKTLMTPTVEIAPLRESGREKYTKANIEALVRGALST